jgi:hypothetical protein
MRGLLAGTRDAAAKTSTTDEEHLLLFTSPRRCAWSLCRLRGRRSAENTAGNDLVSITDDAGHHHDRGSIPEESISASTVL